MNKIPKKQLTHWLSVIVIGIVLGLALQFVRAWTEPTQAPPGGNVGAPINTSANPQIKAGNFTSDGIISAGDQFCLRGVCISAWPSGNTTTTATTTATTTITPVQMYQCPDWSGYGNTCPSQNGCWGQVQSSPTCHGAWYDADAFCQGQNTPCSPI